MNGGDTRLATIVLTSLNRALLGDLRRLCACSENGSLRFAVSLMTAPQQREPQHSAPCPAQNNKTSPPITPAFDLPPVTQALRAPRSRTLIEGDIPW
jgi:hypothetical protein